MDNQTNNRIREELQKYLNGRSINFDDVELLNETIKFFLSKIDELLKSQREELVEKIENLPLNLEAGNERHKIFSDGFEVARENILSLIKEDK